MRRVLVFMPREPMPSFSKREAVQIQIECAIQMHDAGNPVCAITLAGAAEEAMPPAKETLFSLTVDVISLFGAASHKKSHGSEIRPSDGLNRNRNWLKHFSTGEPEIMEIEGSGFMINRALSRYAKIYGEETMSVTMFSFFNDRGIGG